MKKIALVLSVLAILLVLFTACEAHEHKFATEWSTDEDYHWHECEAVDGCPEKDAKEAHDFEVVTNKDGEPVNKCKVCGYTNKKVSTAPEHEHVFADEYSSSENFHWHACTVEGCYEKKDKVEHAFGNPDITYTDGKMTIKRVCVDCEFESVEELNVNTEVDDSLSWDDAFKNFEFTNFTLDVYFEDLIGSTSQHNHCVVTEDSIFYSIPTYHEFYSVRNSDGTCRTYEKYGTATNYTLLSDTSDSYLTSGQRETIIQISFEENFDKFTYDEATASYVCEEPILAKCYGFGGAFREMYCYNSVVKITDGKISYISANYYFNESDLQFQVKSLIYANIGLSAVEIPQSVIDNAING